MPNITIRPWKMEDAPDLAAALNNKKVQDQLRDGLPFPYTEKDSEEFISFVLNAVTAQLYGTGERSASNKNLYFGG